MTENEFIKEMEDRGYTEEEAREEIEFWKNGGKPIPLEKLLLPERPVY